MSQLKRHFDKNDVYIKKCFVVTYWEENKEPVVTVFDNKSNANKYHNYIKEKYNNTCIDECYIYSTFDLI